MIHGVAVYAGDNRYARAAREYSLETARAWVRAVWQGDVEADADQETRVP